MPILEPGVQTVQARRLQENESSNYGKSGDAVLTIVATGARGRSDIKTRLKFEGNEWRIKSAIIEFGNGAGVNLVE